MYQFFIHEDQLIFLPLFSIKNAAMLVRMLTFSKYHSFNLNLKCKTFYFFSFYYLPLKIWINFLYLFLLFHLLFSFFLTYLLCNQDSLHIIVLLLIITFFRLFFIGFNNLQHILLQNYFNDSNFKLINLNFNFNFFFFLFVVNFFQ